MKYDAKAKAVRKQAAQQFLEAVKAKGFKSLVSEEVEETIGTTHSIHVKLNAFSFAEAKLAERAAIDAGDDIFWVLYAVNGLIQVSFE